MNTTQQGQQGPVQTQIGEYLYSRKTKGRYKKKTLKYLNRHIQLSTVPYYLRFEAVNPYLTTACGKLPIFNYYDTTGNIAYMPIRLFDLTSIKQGASGYPTAGWELRQNNTVNTTFVAVSGTNASGAVSNTYNVEDVSSVDAPQIRRASLKYVNIRMLLYGTKTVPVRYEIGIMRVKEDEYNPGYILDNGGTATSQFVGAFWQYLVAKFGYNPIQIYDPQEFRRHYTYTPIKSFMLETTQTNEGSSSIPHAQQFDFFYKKDHCYKFDWNNNSVLQPTDVLNAPNFPTVDVTQMKTGPDYKYREFLVVRALTSHRRGGGAPTFANGTDPSFDIIIRQKWEIPEQ